MTTTQLLRLQETLVFCALLIERMGKETDDSIQALLDRSRAITRRLNYTEEGEPRA